MKNKNIYYCKALKLIVCMLLTIAGRSIASDVGYAEAYRGYGREIKNENWKEAQDFLDIIHNKFAPLSKMSYEAEQLLLNFLQIEHFIKETDTNFNRYGAAELSVKARFAKQKLLEALNLYRIAQLNVQKYGKIKNIFNKEISLADITNLYKKLIELNKKIDGLLQDEFAKIASSIPKPSTQQFDLMKANQHLAEVLNPLRSPTKIEIYKKITEKVPELDGIMLKLLGEFKNKRAKFIIRDAHIERNI